MRRERLSREWSPEEVVERLAADGYVVRVDYYRQIEAGPKMPGEPFLRALQDLFDSKPEPLPPPAPAPEADLAAAIREQAAAIGRLADALAAQQEHPPEWADALARALGVRLRGSGTGGSGEPPGSGALPVGR